MKWKVYSSVFMLLLMSQCKIDRDKGVDRDRFTFRIKADSHLFFKNVRQLYYDFTDLPAAHLHVYRLSDRYQGDDYPVLQPTLVIDWMKEEAYVLIEGNAIVNDETAWKITEQEPGSERSFAYQLQERGSENMLEFGTKIYEGIMAGNQFFITIGNRTVPLLESETDRENFRVVMADYYRLTRVFR